MSVVVVPLRLPGGRSPISASAGRWSSASPEAPGTRRRWRSGRPANCARTGNEWIKSPETLPLLIALTRLRDDAHRSQMLVDPGEADDPFRVLLASNYLPPFYTHAPAVDGHP